MNELTSTRVLSSEVAMRRVLVAAMAVVLLSACGDGGERAEVTASSPTPCVAPTPVEPPPASMAEFSREERVRFTNQELIHNWTDPVLDPYRENTDSGFASIRVNLENLSAQITWRGTPPADVARLVGTSPTCVRVDLVQAAYTRADVDRAYQALERERTAGRLPDYSGAQPNKAFDGLEIGFTPADFAALSTEANRAKFEAAAGMPVTFVVIDAADGLVGRTG